jgi:hypothetical protein
MDVLADDRQRLERLGANRGEVVVQAQADVAARALPQVPRLDYFRGLARTVHPLDLVQICQKVGCVVKLTDSDRTTRTRAAGRALLETVRVLSKDWTRRDKGTAVAGQKKRFRLSGVIMATASDRSSQGKRLFKHKF